MANWLYTNCYGKYRLKLPIDKNTNDFPRNVDKNGKYGSIEDIDMYIPCKYGEISYYGHGKLNVFITSQIVGKRIIKELTVGKGVTLYNLVEGDGEFGFTVTCKQLDYLASNMKAQTMGKNIRPTSTKNLPTSDYEIPIEKIEEYKKITAGIPIGEGLKVKSITDRFLTEILAKKYKIKDIGSDMKLRCMARQRKEYIDSYGMWDEYVEFLEKELAKDA